MRTSIVGCLSMGFVVVVSAVAHDLYVMPERFLVAGGDRVKVAFHNGDAFPESEASVKVERLRDVVVRSSLKTAPLEDLRVDGNRTVGLVSIPGTGSLLVSGRTIPNLIELEPKKFEEYLKEEGLPEIVDWRHQHGESAKAGRERYSKYVKSLMVAGSPNENYRTVTGLLIEIVPEKDPYLLHPGESLPVRVLFRGAPAANLQIEAAWAGAGGKAVTVAGRTDANGRLAVPLAKAGKWRIHTIKMERCADQKAADWESFWASLTFELR